MPRLALGPFSVYAGLKPVPRNQQLPPPASPPWRRPLINPLANFSGIYLYSLNKVLMLLLKQKPHHLPILVDRKLSSLPPSSLPCFPSSSNMELIIALFFHVLNFHLFFPKSSTKLKKAKKTTSVSVSTELCRWVSGSLAPPAAPQCSPCPALSLHHLHIAVHSAPTCLLFCIPFSFSVFSLFGNAFCSLLRTRAWEIIFEVLHI